MYRDADFDAAQRLPDNTDELERDLDLPTVYTAMAAGDPFLYDVARQGVLSGLREPAAIACRQDVLRDCIAEPELTRRMYELAVEAITRERKNFMGALSKYPTTILNRSVEVLRMLVETLHRLRAMAEAGADRFSSTGFRTFCTMVIEQLPDDYFVTVDDHLRKLAFRHGIVMSARIGRSNKGSGYVLRSPLVNRRTLGDLFHGRSKLSFTLPERDEAGHRALAELRDRGINLVADGLAQSTDHMVSFCAALRTELGFYIGCLNLHDALQARSAPSARPQASASGSELSAAGLYDVALALTADSPVVSNDIVADGKNLIVITGANRGGKSTFLRSIGLAYLMMQAGMFVPATAFRASTPSGVFTHFKREEDASMRSGKLDEELARMSVIVDRISPGGVLLSNESFASTNEREGSEIARQILTALAESGVRVVAVTHLYDLSEGLYQQRHDDALFLRAERGTGGARTFRLHPGEPLPTSFGPDLYARIFRVPQDGEDRHLAPSPGPGSQQRASMA